MLGIIYITILIVITVNNIYQMKSNKNKINDFDKNTFLPNIYLTILIYFTIKTPLNKESL